MGFFADGLAHDYLKMKVMRENPATLKATVASAKKEQNLRNRFNLRIGRVTDSNVPSIEPMEIDHLRPKKVVLNIINYDTMQGIVIVGLMLMLLF